MKLHYTKILLFSLPLNILAHSKYKSYITQYTPSTTSRGLSECDISTSIYDTDPDMKTVKEIFDRQTSQRLEEYNERMNKNRQKCKEQCDKDIQQIISKEKIQKSLEEKVEKGCLRCGCGLGCGVAPVWGLVSGLWYATWLQYVAKSPIQKGIEAVISQLEGMPGINRLPGFNLANIINAKNYSSSSLIIQAIDDVAKPICDVQANKTLSFCSFSSYEENTIIMQVSRGAESVARAGIDATAAEASILEQKTLILTNTITTSFIVIVVIVLVMLIIYLILRYRRKKKMNKKQQYTKLLKE
ncbi:PIR protein, putative [Plasmodium sp. gorilla clade G1]|nr:PIR protein, putative [Plasmodium sp. gorilla clade G1]